MIIFERKNESKGTLRKVAGKKDGTLSDEIQWDLDIGFIIGENERHEADAIIPGTRDLLESGNHEITCTDKTKRPDVELLLVDGNGVPIVEGVRAEILQTKIKIKGTVAGATVKLRFQGNKKDAGSLFGRLGESITVNVDPYQKELPFGEPKPKGRTLMDVLSEDTDTDTDTDIDTEEAHENGIELKPEHTVVATADGKAVGLVVSATKDNVTFTTLAGQRIKSALADIQIVADFDPPEGTTVKKQVAGFKRRAKRKHLPFEWGHLLKAANFTNGVGKAELSHDLVDRALEIAAQAKGPVPPSAG